MAFPWCVCVRQTGGGLHLHHNILILTYILEKCQISIKECTKHYREFVSQINLKKYFIKIQALWWNLLDKIKLQCNWVAVIGHLNLKLAAPARSPRTRAEPVSLAEEDSCSLRWRRRRAEGEETQSITLQERESNFCCC